jgi:ABC-type multidrug transport system fused ATPase/permease subunit
MILLNALVDLVLIAINFWALPLFVGQFVLFIEEKEEALWIKSGYGNAGILFGLQVVGTLLKSAKLNLNRATVSLAGSTLRTGIYRKIFSLSPKARAVHVGAKLINNLNVDCDILSFTPLTINSLWMIPLQIAIAVFFLAQSLGVALWPSFSMIVIAAAATVWSGVLMGPYFGTLMSSSDQRVKAITEAVKGMKVIKYFALEDTIEQGICKFRDLQVQTSFILCNIIILAQGLSGLVPLLMPVIAYMVYATQYSLTPSVIFSSLLLFRNLQQPLESAGGLVQMFANGKAAWDRVSALFAAESESVLYDQLPLSTTSEKDHKGYAELPVSTQAGRIVFHDAVLEYPNDNTDSTDTVCALKVSNLEIKPGSMVGIVGRVGAGKTTLFNGILKNLIVSQGQVEIEGTIGYCSQKPILFDGSIKNNILFANDLNIQRLEKTLELCCLKEDLDRLPAGVDSKLGEGGASLSGGQMARVALARAIYQNPDIYLLDDPLSALDAAVGRNVFKSIKEGLKGKTVLLATHHLQYMSEMDQIIIVENGEVIETGSYEELLSLNGVFAQMIDNYTHEHQDHEEVEAKSKDEKKNSDEDEEIIKKESAAEGSVDWKIYQHYIEALGKVTFGVMVFLFVAELAFKASLQLWLANGTRSSSEVSTSNFLIVYGILGVVAALVDFSSFWFAARGTIIAGKNLHMKALKGILAAPISFFEANPMGRILNRFTADTESVDLGLLNVVLGIMGSLMSVLLSLILVAQANWVLMRMKDSSSNPSRSHCGFLLYLPILSEIQLVNQKTYCA